MCDCCCLQCSLKKKKKKNRGGCGCRSVTPKSSPAFNESVRLGNGRKGKHACIAFISTRTSVHAIFDYNTVDVFIIESSILAYFLTWVLGKFSRHSFAVGSGTLCIRNHGATFSCDQIFAIFLKSRNLRKLCFRMNKVVSRVY